MAGATAILATGAALLAALAAGAEGAAGMTAAATLDTNDRAEDMCTLRQPCLLWLSMAVCPLFLWVG